MKKALIALAALAALAVVAFLPLSSSGEVGICDPQQSALCSGLVEVWSFDEAVSDGDRFGSYANGILLEPSAVDVAYTASGKLSNAASFTGSNSFVIPRFGSGMFTSSFTVSAWVYLASTGAQTILATNAVGDTQNAGIIIGVDSNTKPRLAVWENETDTSNVYTYASALTTGTWKLVTWKLSPFGPYGKAQACIAVDNGAFTCGNLTYNPRRNAGDLTVGGRNGEYLSNGSKLDALGIWTRTWSPADLALYYNSGTGRAFPFY